MRLMVGMGEVSDTSTLAPGANISFTVISDQVRGCPFIEEKDVIDTLNNWVSDVVDVVEVSTNAWGYVPTVVDIDVRLVVKKETSAGWLRGQIQKALTALADATLDCYGLRMQNDVMNVSGGGGGAGGTQGPPPKPKDNGIPWSTTLVVVSVAAVGAIFLAKR